MNLRHAVRLRPSLASNVIAMPQPSAAGARRRYWWGDALQVDDKTLLGLVREIEVTKGRQETHERECTHRYERLDDRLKLMAANLDKAGADIAAVAKSVGAMERQQRDAAWSINWKAWALAGTLVAALLASLAWTAGQLYALEPLRVQAEQGK